MSCTTECVREHPDVSDVAALDLVERLVQIPSVSGQEAAAVAVFVDSAQKMGFDASVDAAGNGVASRGAGRSPRKQIVLLGHIDTVPGEIPVRVEGGVLFGRGSVDAKGPLAAMLAAASRAELADGVALHVIAAVGEESAESPGAKWARDRMSPDACIIGEPSGWDGVTLGYKGRLIVRARCERDSAHSAGPGETPADSLFTWWTRITNRLESLNNNRAGVFDRVQYSIASTRSNTDGLTARGELDCGFRLPMWLGPDELFIEIQRLTGEEIVISHRGGEQTCRSDRNDPVVRALVRSVREVGGMRAREKVKTGTADFNVVAPQWGCPIAAYGPGDSSLDHTPNERLCLNEYLASVRVMTNAIEMIAFELAGDIR